MDRTVKVGYYNVIEGVNSPNFVDLIQGLAARPIHNREVDVGNGILVRLERLEIEEGLFVGMFTRRQLDNLPPEATEDGLEPLPLPDGSGVGHTVVFCYDPQNRCLAYQQNKFAVSLGRLASYLFAIDQTSDFEFRPFVTGDAWRRFNAGEPRKLLIQLANLRDVGLVESDEDGLIENLIRQSEAFEAPQITIEISMGRRTGSLNYDVARRTLQRVLERLPGGAQVNKVSAATKANDGSGTDEIDFLHEFLADEDSLYLSRNPEENYAVRKAFILTRFLRRRAAMGIA